MYAHILRQEKENITWKFTTFITETIFPVLVLLLPVAPSSTELRKWNGLVYVLLYELVCLVIL